MRSLIVCGPVARCLLWLGLCSSVGCQLTPYQYGRFRTEGSVAPPLEVTHGGPNERLDRLQKIVQFPKKLFSFGRKTDEPTLEQTEQEVVEYLEKNDLTDVYLAVNEHNPKDQWRRLQENRRIAPVWRYTVGTASLVGYTLLPPRVFSRDNYNPFTNTLHLNSTDPNRGLYEAAWAKDVHARQHPGSYVVISSMPGLSFAREARKAADVVGYLQAEEEWDLETKAYPTLYAQLGSSGAGLAGPFVPALVGPALGLGGSLVGHAAGRIVAAQRSKEIELVRAQREESGEGELLADDEEAPAVIRLVGGEWVETPTDSGDSGPDEHDSDHVTRP